MGPKHVWASSIFFEKKINQPKGSRQGKKRRCVFLVCCLGCVLLAATTICTYNVGALHHGCQVHTSHHLWPCALSKDFCALQGGVD